MVQMFQIWVLVEVFQTVFTSLVILPHDVGIEQRKCFRKLLEDFFVPLQGFSVVGSSEIPGIFLSNLMKTENVLTSAQLILVLPDQIALANLNNLQDRRFLIMGEEDLSSKWLAAAEKNRNKWLLAHWSFAGQLKVSTNLQQKNLACSAQFYYRKYQDFCKSVHFTSEKVNLSLPCQLRVIQIPGETLAAHANGKHVGLVYKIVEIYAKWKQIDLFTDTAGVSEFFNNGSLQSILAHLENNSYDVATGPLFINSLEVDYGPVLYKDSYIFAIKKFKVEVRKMYITVFQSTVWRCWYAAFLAACFFYYFANFSLGNNVGLHKSLLDIIRLNFSQGTGLTTRRFTSLRLFTVGYLLGNLIICTVYTGRISSILTASHFEKATIKKLYSIMIRPDVHYLYSAYMDSLLGVTEVGKRRMSRDGLEKLLIKTNWTEWDNLHHVVFKENGYYAAVTLKSLSLVHPSESELFDTFIAQQPFTWLMTFYISKKSPLRNSLKFWTNEMFEKGLTNKWLADIVEENRKYSRVSKQQPDEGNAISFNNFKEFNVVLGMGYGCGLGALILEFACFWMESRFKVKEKVVALLLLLKPPEDLWRK